MSDVAESPAPNADPASTPTSTSTSAVPPIVAEIEKGYGFDGPAVELGALIVDDSAYPAAAVRIPLAMLNRHGLVAGATGTGKTKSLQLMAEQLVAAGVPVFLADIKGDLSGIGAPGAASDKLTRRTESIGQTWIPTAYPIEVLTLGDGGSGIPVRATISGFGPTLLSKVLGLSEVQESSLGLVFHYADAHGLPLLDIKDLREVIKYLVSDDGQADLADLGGLAKSTAGVLLRQLIAFADQGADTFFGEPEFQSGDLLRVAPDGRGYATLLELPSVQDKPAVFSTFLMWLLADLFHDLPEVGDLEKPKLVFFFDEAHLLFHDASKAFLDSVAQTVRLIRSKGVGIFFVTQQPTDVPDNVLAQLGSRVQHQLRAHTPNDAKALRATVATYPTSSYDLGQLLTTLGIGEAVVTVMDEDGAPTPVAWTRMRAPMSLMSPAPAETMSAAVANSPLRERYATTVDRESAYEMLTARLTEGAARASAEQAAADKARQAKELEAELARPQKSAPTGSSPETASEGGGADLMDKIFRDATKYKTFDGMAKSAGRTIATEFARGIFGIGRRR